MSQEILRDYKKLEIRHLDECDEDIEALLGHTLLGTEGGLRYSVLNHEERMKSYGKGLSFLALFKRNSLIGAIGLCKRKTFNCGEGYNTTFLRYLSIRSSFQISHVSRRKRERLSAFEDSFKKQIFSMFSNALQDIQGKGHPSDPHVAYAFIESSNERSRNFAVQGGYEQVSSFYTTAFSRFNPRMDPAVSRLSNTEEEEMGDLLDEQYRDFCFYYDEFRFFNKGYYVLRKDNQIVAGANAMPAVFKIVDFPGLAGWILLNILPYTPYFRKLFSRGKFRFLILDSVYCRPGYEDQLPRLFEGICASESCSSALTWHDEKSSICRALRSNRRLGVLNRILKTEPGLVVASFSNLDEEKKSKFSELPVYVSGVDLV
ncbi:MAG TPA: hypothetical protein PLV06_01450 [Bacteroidales bacterium]|nr:hypothetical protein [Bacteroidales bacterium]HPF03455.1 hypothetical protein [Bacteroidales bacterium]HPJ58869.1 hypothetical protein [Bacteroidales bacterium]HPR11024.1 hypothetical protein [Bacteroidales bacterium]HRW84449.1 hypothetical protein [Bacteroidales bacterium]